MKKILLFVAAVALVSVSALAQQSAQHGSGTNGLWLCHDPGAPRIQCDTATAPLNSMKCCWKNDPLYNPRGVNDGGKGGDEPTVCDKLTWPEIVHRPRCSDFGPSQCKQYDPIKRCEDLMGVEGEGKLTACCWEGPQPSETGDRGSNGGKGGKGVTTNSGINTPKAPKAPKGPTVTKGTKGVVTSTKVQPAKKG